jgi:hypothetical protein
MSDESPKPPPPTPAEVHDDEDRDAILARRNRFVSAALAGLAGASLVAACGGEVSTPNDAGSPQPCLSPTAQPDAGNDSAPQPCLSPLPPDAGQDAGNDATPQPCLSPLPPDAGDAGGD